MSLEETIFGALLVVVLLALGIVVGWRQVKLLLRHPTDLSPFEQTFQRRQAQRRLMCSILMVIFAGFLIGWFFLAQDLAAVEIPEGEPAFQHPLVKTITYFWIGALLVLFCLLSLAAIDLVATARHGFRSVRLLENQRREELAEELAAYRRRRAEMN